MNSLRDFLIETLSSSYAWPFECLATAVGIPGSVARTKGMLSAKVLGSKSPNRAKFPHIVQRRVKALMAFDPQLLPPITAQWKQPGELENSNADHLWLGAWVAAMPHLKRIGAIDRNQVDVPVLKCWVEELWYEPAEVTVSWYEVISEARIPYGSRLRAFTRCQFTEPVLTVDDIKSAPVFMLDLLRGRAAELLDESAKALVIEKALICCRLQESGDCWGSVIGKPGTIEFINGWDNNGGALVFLELGLELSPTIYKDIAKELAELIDRFRQLNNFIDPDQTTERIAYVLLDAEKRAGH